MAESKVVLLHDWLTGFRGGERVLEAMCELYKDAPLYTLIYDKGSASPLIEDRKITVSALNKIPGISTHYRKFLPFFPSAIDNLKIKENAQVVLSSSHCVIKGLKKPKGSIHISYIHSPMRYMYDQFEVYFGKHAPLYQQLGAKAFRSYITNWDIKSNENVDYMIANSAFIQKRIKQYYNRESVVIHPFVDLKDFRPLQSGPNKKEDFYLMVTAFAPNKRVDLAIETFNQNKKRLKIIGSGQQEKWLKSIANPNIEFYGNLSREEVIQNMRSARGFIFPGVEDFGITPLESLASGTPVIAFKEGGVLETLTPETATFFTEATSQSLNDAINRFEKENFDLKNLYERAEEFSKESFQKKISNFISQVR